MLKLNKNLDSNVNEDFKNVVNKDEDNVFYTSDLLNYYEQKEYIKYTEKFIGVDIAVNLTYFKEDLQNEIMIRSFSKGILPVLVGMDKDSNAKVIELAKKYKTFCYVGYHPNHIETCEISQENVNVKEKINILKNLIKEDVVIGVGECGLDFCRNTNKEEQIEWFKEQLKINTKKPYFLHMRDAFEDFINVIKPYKEKLKNSVVHSFTGTVDEARYLLDFGLKIGINGCSMKDSVELVKEIPLDDLLIETDSPFCLIRKKYAAADYCQIIKAKSNEPALLENVAEAISSIKNISKEKVFEKGKVNFIK